MYNQCGPDQISVPEAKVPLGQGDWASREGAGASVGPCLEGDTLLHVACRAGQIGEASQSANRGETS